MNTAAGAIQHTKSTVTVVHQKDKKRALSVAVKRLSIEKGSKIAIKPNISIQEKKACTDFELLTYLIEHIKRFQPQKIFIVESDTYLRSIWETYDALGYHSLDVDLVNLSEEACTTVWPGETSFLKAFPYPNLFKDIDCLISFGKLKTHILTIYTGVLKNQFGLLPFPDKRLFHRKLDQVISDVNILFPCDFYILDGVTAMHGEGPLNGDSIELNLLFSGTNPVAIDHCACTAVGINPHTVSHILHAHKMGIGTFDYRVEGTVPEIRRFNLPESYSSKN